MTQDIKNKELQAPLAYIPASAEVIEISAQEIVCLSSTETDDLVNDNDPYDF